MKNYASICVRLIFHCVLCCCLTSFYECFVGFIYIFVPVVNLLWGILFRLMRGCVIFPYAYIAMCCIPPFVFFLSFVCDYYLSLHYTCVGVGRKAGVRRCEAVSTFFAENQSRDTCMNRQVCSRSLISMTDTHMTEQSWKWSWGSDRGGFMHEDEDKEGRHWAEGCKQDSLLINSLPPWCFWKQMPLTPTSAATQSVNSTCHAASVTIS